MSQANRAELCRERSSRRGEETTQTRDLAPSLSHISHREYPLIPPDRLLKLREVFNKAGEGKTKLSVNDFSEPFLFPAEGSLADSPSCQGRVTRFGRCAGS